MMPLYVVLDLDDTLFLERDYVFSGFTAVGGWAERRFGIPDFASRARSEFECGRRGDIFNSALQTYGIQPCIADIAAMVQVYRRHWPRIDLSPDASDFLNKAHGRIRLGLITDGALDSQVRKARALGLNRAIDVMVFTGEWGKRYSKPHPRAFKAIESRLGGHGWRFLYVADNPAKDFITPIAMNWATVRIRRQGGLHSSLEATPSAAPDAELDSFRGLDALLRQYARSVSGRAAAAKGCATHVVAPAS